MMKWLRKHNKEIMVVVVLFAMFAFIGGDALYSIASPGGGDQPYARVFGQQVTRGDLAPASMQTTILEKLFIPWQYDFRDRAMAVHHWYILAREAELAGISVSDAEVEENLENLRKSMVERGIPENYIENLRATARITLSQIRSAIRQHLAIQKLFTRVSNAAVPSEPELRHFVLDTQDKIRVQFVTLDARQFVEPTEPIDESALAAMFEAHKDLTPEESDTGIGYKFPRRVRIEYLKTSVNEIEKNMEATLDEQTAHWRKNRGRFTKEIEVEDPAADPTATQPAKVKKTVEMTFSEAQERVRKEIRKNKAMQLAQQAMRKVARELLRPWEKETADAETGFKPIPPAVQEPGYLKAVGDRLAAEFGIPITHHETGLLTQAQLSRESGVQYASIRGEGGRNLMLPEYAFRVAPFFKSNPRRNEDMSTWLQLMQTPDVPLEGMTFEVTGTTFVQDTVMIVFRVIEAREAESPASLDEVREAVEKDCREKLAYERIEPIAREVAKAASLVGLEEAVTLFEDLRNKQRLGGVNRPQPFARRTNISTNDQSRFMDALANDKPTLVPSTVAGVGRPDETRILEKFIDACFEMAADGWQPEPLEVPETEQLRMATTRPAPASTPMVRLVGIPEAKKWFVVQYLSHEPVDQNAYETEHRPRAESELAIERSLRLRMKWFSPEEIEARSGFVFLQPDGQPVTKFGGLQSRDEVE